MKPRVHSQPSPTAPVWLSHRKLGFLCSLLSLSLSLILHVLLQYASLSLSLCMFLYVAMCFLVVSFCFISVCLHWLICLFVSISPLFCVLFSSDKHTHTPPFLFPCLSVCHRQRTGLAGGVQLGSTNTWLSICLLVCAGMVFLFYAVHTLYVMSF